MPQLLPGSLRDHKDVTLPGASSSSFWLNGSAWQYPDFENAETFVQRLAKAGVISRDSTIDAALRRITRSTTDVVFAIRTAAFSAGHRYDLRRLSSNRTGAVYNKSAEGGCFHC